jgi:HD-GYP domain-containing protein (c-di-GMP phosphodiesterase class II)
VKERVATCDLQHGMFVAELDRPWLGTPFLLQGFLIDDETQIRDLQQWCRFVYVDRLRSVGVEFAAPTEPEWPAEQDRPAPARRTVSVMREGTEERPDFFELLRFIRAQNEIRRAEATPTGGTPPPSVTTAPGGKPLHGPEHHPDPTGGLGNPLRKSRDGGDDEAGLLRYATSWLRPLSDWLRGDAADAEGDTADAPAGDGGARQGSGEGSPIIVKEEVALEEELVRAHPLYEEAQTSVEHLILELEEQRTPDLDKVRDSVAGLVSSVVRNPDAVIWLNRLKRTDQYSYNHALEVSVLLMVAGRQIGLSEGPLTALGTAGLLQDLGKIGLPPELLRKRGRITREEYELFKTHVARSLLIFKGNPGISPAIAEIVEKHHERIDGSGYPRGLRGDQIGLFAELAGVADSYCAMTNDTGYRQAFTNQQALERLNRMRDVKFSAQVIDLFIQCIGLYPVGTLVKLNSGEVAVVIAQNRVRRLKPKVMVLLGPDKTPNRYPPTLDLLYDPPSPRGTPYRILRALPPNAYGIDPKEFYLA